MIPAALHRMLREVTEQLAREVAAPSADAPAWSAQQWAVARAVVLMHGIGPLLALRGHWPKSPEWLAFLHEQHRHAVVRHGVLQTFLGRVHEAASARGLPMLALKGAALHALGIYAEGERPMADIDLLVHPQDSVRASELLGSLGLVETMVTWKERCFEPRAGRTVSGFGERADHPVKVELHDRICERMPVSLADITASVFVRDAGPGINAYPSKAALLEHLLLHAAGNMIHKHLRLIHLHDLTRLAALMDRSDWRELLDRRGRMQPLWWAYPPMALAARYAECIPDEVLRALAGRCPGRLVALVERSSFYDLSMSYLWVTAFPGIVWARSLGEALRYGRCRLMPGRQEKTQRQLTVASQAWAAGSSWIRMPQAARIVRWLTGRQMRSATLYVVDAALTGAC
jgi:hypothetical protein